MVKKRRQGIKIRINLHFCFDNFITYTTDEHFLQIRKSDFNSILSPARLHNPQS